MRTQKLSRLINCAALVAAFTLPACGGEPTDTPDPVVTPPVHTGSGMGTLRVSAPSGLTAAIIIVDGKPVSPDFIGLPHDLELSAGQHTVTLQCVDWSAPMTPIMVPEDEMGVVTIEARPDPSPAVGQFDWVDQTGQIVKTETWTAEMDTPNRVRAQGLEPCDTGVLIVRPSRTMCMPSPGKLYFKYNNSESSCAISGTPQEKTTYDCVTRTIGLPEIGYATWVKR